MTTVVASAFGLGVVLGVFLGRWWAELRRAQHDIARVWNSRRRYRRR